MHDVKRIEIIANSVELDKLLNALSKGGSHSHVVMRNVSGKLLGSCNDDLDILMGDNVYIVAFCMPDVIRPVVEEIRPLLNRFGGTCYISDTVEVRSQKCVAKL